MKGVKIMGVSAACGFVLSFFFGLFSRTSILSIFLKAFVSALVFGILGFLINLVYQRFLNDDSDAVFVEGSSKGAADGSKAPSKGQVVDITIQDEDLDKSESNNHFVVGNAHKMLNDSDVSSSVGTVLGEEQVSGQNQSRRNQNVNKSDDKGFVPLAGYETPYNVSEKEAISPKNAVSKRSESSNGKNGFSDNSDFSGSQATSEGIDTLPDIGDLAFDTGTNSEVGDDENVDSDSEFVSSVNKKSDGAPEVKDAALIAKAISSVLSNEQN